VQREREEDTRARGWNEGRLRCCFDNGNSGALASDKYAPHCESMKKGAQLKSSNAREARIVEIG
jgi:hypothetical protein